jgi:hypothetical protein
VTTGEHQKDTTIPPVSINPRFRQPLSNTQTKQTLQRPCVRLRGTVGREQSDGYRGHGNHPSEVSTLEAAQYRPATTEVALIEANYVALLLHLHGTMLPKHHVWSLLLIRSETNGNDPGREGQILAVECVSAKARTHNTYRPLSAPEFVKYWNSSNRRPPITSFT